MTTAATMAESPLSVTEQMLKWERYLRREAKRRARRLGFDPDEVEQEVWVRVLTYGAGYDPARGNFGTWLTVVIRSTVSEMVRVRQVHGGVKAASLSQPIGRNEDGNLGDFVPDVGTIQAVDKTAHHEQLRRVRAAIEALPEEKRESVRARFWRETPIRQCGDRLFEGLDELAETLSDLAPDVDR